MKGGGILTSIHRVVSYEGWWYLQSGRGLLQYSHTKVVVVLGEG